MLTFFRRVSKSKVGTWIMAAVLIAILAGFAASDISNFGSGKIGFGMGADTLASVGDQRVTEREMSEAMQKRLQNVREQNPAADYSTIARDFDEILALLIDQRSLIAFGDKFGFPLSKKLLDGQIAQLPGVKGLDGKVSAASYQTFLQRQQMTDAQVRQLLASGLFQQLILSPVASNARLSVGMATPYASMMLESREGEAAAVPIEPFKAGLKATDADVQQFYAANRNHYMIPEQRALRFAIIGPEQVSGIAATDQEITDYYNKNQAIYGSRETRNLSQVVVPDQATANGIATRAKGGATLAAAAAPAGSNAAVTALADQTRQAYASVAGDKAATAVFGAASGSVVGPVQSEFGWVVVKVESVKSASGKTLAAAHDEIGARLVADKRKAAIEDMVDKIQNAIDDGSNFVEAAGKAKAPVTTTPLIVANGSSLADPRFKIAPELAPAVKTGFEIAPNDPPEIVSLGDKGYAVVSPGQVVAAAPAPLASIRDRVAADWLDQQAFKRAKIAADGIAAKAASGASLADAIKQAGVALPAARPVAARRIQIATAQGQVPPALKMLFTFGQGKAKALPDPQGRGFYIVKVTKIVPGNATLQPGLISQMQRELREELSEDYARQFVAAIKAELKAKKNDSAIQTMKTRLLTSGN
ncbi:hypothetical protein GCM10022276_05050 [Sphingomonas limnosediminicola]|uniref:Parvulin-like PPIase n=1 Tax=Sphingomonas limnosediminicola TaxID=940133 RepID=A0ABP7KYI4_9SPHN